MIIEDVIIEATWNLRVFILQHIAQMGIWLLELVFIQVEDIVILGIRVHEVLAIILELVGTTYLR